MIEPNKLADMGDLLILFGWEKAGDRMQAGAGLVFLTETLKCLRKMVSNLKVIATDLHPFQFMDIRYDRRIVHRDFKEARKILRSYWDKVKPELALDKDAECLIYDDMNATVAAAPQLAGERLSAAARLVRCKDTQNLSAVQRQANSVR
jgi:hypothetical protein